MVQVTTEAHDYRVWDNILAGVGHTPVVSLTSDRGAPVFVKLESFNPTGSFFDRAALASELVGITVHVHRNDPMATAFAALGALLGRSVFFCAEPGDSDFRWHARALGATELPCGPACSRSVHVSWPQVIKSLAEEVSVDLEPTVGPVKMLIPAGSSEWAVPIGSPELSELPPRIASIEVINEPASLTPRTISRLPLLDPYTTTLLERELASATEPTVVVALCDGAVEWPGGREEKGGDDA